MQAVCTMNASTMRLREPLEMRWQQTCCRGAATAAVATRRRTSCGVAAATDATRAAAAAAAPPSSPQQQPAWPQRLAVAAAAAAAALVVAGAAPPPVPAAEAALVPFENAAQQYRLAVPESWERKGKAGADALFEDPERRSTSVGVTVSPVRVASLDAFGSLEAVGARLLETEAKKESTLDVRMVSEAARRGAGGAALYDYEYELNSTRGRKRIVNTVSITGSKLYILNGQFKCAKEGCSADDEAAVAELRRVAASFDAGALSSSGGGDGGTAQ